jgi:hemolysin activation/secretion protein
MALNGVTEKRRAGRAPGDRLRRGLALSAVFSTAALAAGAASAQTPPPADRTAAQRFAINAFQVKGSTLLSDADIERAVYPHEGPDKTPDDVEAARAALQAVYEKHGYATATVFIPEQGVDSGVIRLEVNEQTIGQVTVTGGKRTSASWVLQRAPSLQTGTTPNFQAVQRDVVALNQSPDRKVTPEVKAGIAPGTVDVNLKVEDHSPIHGSVEYNNYDSVSTTQTRVSVSLRDDDLWGRGDSLSLSVQTAPEHPDDGTVYSGNYLLRLPANLQLLAYALHTDSNIAVVGGTNVVGKGTQAGVKLIVPLTSTPVFYQSFTAGIDWKDFQENDVLGPNATAAPVTYWPITLGWRGDLTLTSTRAYLNASGVFGTGIGDNHDVFNNKRFTARPDFFAFKGEVGDTTDIPFGLQTFVKVTGQFSNDALVPSEQFSLGGIDTVRGYYESETLGDYGVAVQSELRSPSFAKAMGDWTNEARLHVFFDAGYAGIHQPLIGQQQTYTLYSAGVGARFKFINHLNGDVNVAAPLTDGPDKSAGAVTVRARIWGDF